jgi:protein-disulfide isomerase
VTIVQFSDYQCPFCSRVEPTINKVMEEYKGKVRVAWRDLPLPFHPNAMPGGDRGARRGRAGQVLGDARQAVRDQQHLDRETYEKYAQELGLNMGKFKAALDAQKGKEAIEADAAAGNKIGARGTPAFFINGKFLSGRQPFESFKAKIDEELKTAEALVAKGTPKGHVYEALLKEAKSDVPAAPAAPAGGEDKGPEADTKTYEVAAVTRRRRGPKAAPARGHRLLRLPVPVLQPCGTVAGPAGEGVPGKVRFVWKNYPLPFHNNAEPAAEAAMAAHAQGKFWQMHDKLFQNQQSLDRPSLEKHAQDLGLNMAKFKPISTPRSTRADRGRDQGGTAVGVKRHRRPVFINGRKIAAPTRSTRSRRSPTRRLGQEDRKKRG